MAAKTYRTAIIGCGRVAWLLNNDPLIPEKPCSHAGAYQAVDRAEIIAAADTDTERLRDFSSEYGIDATYTDYREMLQKEQPEIVSVCAYATERYAMVTDCIKSGVKGIWSEKAFATSLSEADEMERLCREYDTHLIVSHMRRWDQDFQLAQKLISGGEIGEPVSAVCHFSGNMIHTGTHAYDVLRYLFGDAEWVEGHLEIVSDVSHHDAFQSTEKLIAHDVGGYALIFFKNGAYATVHGDSKGFFHFEFDIMGTKGRIRIGNWLFELYQAEESKTESGLVELYRKDISHGEKKNIWTEAANNLIDCMEGKSENFSGPGDGMAALEIALAIHQSSNNGGKAVGLPLVERDFRIPSR